MPPRLSSRYSILRRLRQIEENPPAAGGGEPEAMWKPPYGSLKAAVSDPALTIVRSGLNASMLYLTRVYVPEEEDFTTVHWITTTAANGITLAELGVWNSDLQLLGRSGDVKAKFLGQAGPQSQVLTPVRSLDNIGGEGEWVYVGHHQVGGTARAAMAGHNLAVAGLALLDGSPPRCTTQGSVSALPDEIDPLDIAGGGSTNMMWYGLS
jgi:hypothetical protein